MKNIRLGFIGGGSMCSAIATGLVRYRVLPAEHITICDTHQSKLDHLQASLGVQTILNDRNSNLAALEMAQQVDALVLAIKPKSLGDMLEQLNQVLKPETLVFSIMAGVSLEKLEKHLKNPVLRLMPNTPMQVGEGVTAMAAGSLVREDHLDLAHALFTPLGALHQVSESMMGYITNVSGCGPAYVYMFIEAMANAGVKLGIPAKLSQELAAQAVLGAAKMVLETGEHPATLKEAVCSPGGTTIQGVHALEQRGFRGVVMDGVLAPDNR